MDGLTVAAPSPEHFPLRRLVPLTPSTVVQLLPFQLKLNLCVRKEKGEGKEESLLRAKTALKPHFLRLRQNSALFPLTTADVNRT